MKKAFVFFGGMIVCAVLFVVCVYFSSETYDPTKLQPPREVVVRGDLSGGSQPLEYFKVENASRSLLLIEGPDGRLRKAWSLGKKFGSFPQRAGVKAYAYTLNGNEYVSATKLSDEEKVLFLEHYSGGVVKGALEWVGVFSLFGVGFLLFLGVRQVCLVKAKNKKRALRISAVVILALAVVPLCIGIESERKKDSMNLNLFLGQEAQGELVEANIEEATVTYSVGFRASDFEVWPRHYMFVDSVDAKDAAQRMFYAYEMVQSERDYKRVYFFSATPLDEADKLALLDIHNEPKGLSEWCWALIIAVVLFLAPYFDNVRKMKIKT